MGPGGYICLIFLLAQAFAFAGQGHGLASAQRPQADSQAPTSCLATLNDAQKTFLAGIREDVNQGASAKEIADTIYRRASRLPASQRDLAIGLSMAAAIEQSRKSRPFLPENAEALAVLLRRGASVKSGELDLSHFDLNHPLSIREKEALRSIFPESAAMIPRIDDPDRVSPVFLGRWIVLPKEKLQANGRFRVMTVDEYEWELDQKRRDFSRAMSEYVKKDNVSNSAMSRFFNWSRSKDRATLEASNRVSVLISELVNDYGIPAEYGNKMRADFSKALLQSNGNIAAGIKKMETSVATAAALIGVTAIVIAVPELWPVAAKAYALLTTTAPGVTALSSGGFVLAGSAGKMLISSGVSTYHGQGSFICNLGNHMFEEGPAVIGSTLKAAGIGLVAGAVASQLINGARYMGVAESTLGGLAKTTTVLSVIPPLWGARNAHEEANYYRQLAEEARKRGDEALAEQYSADIAQGEARAGWRAVQALSTPYLANRVRDYLLNPSLHAQGAGAAATSTSGLDPYNDVDVPDFPEPANVPNDFANDRTIGRGARRLFRTTLKIPRLIRLRATGAITNGADDVASRQKLKSRENSTESSSGY